MDPEGDPDERRTLPAPLPNEAPRRAAAPVAPAPERLGRYEILFELARGGMGTVYAGRLVGVHGFDRLVAIKRLHADGGNVEAFLAEARLGGRILHPNVVETIELGEHEGAPYLAMQLIEGVSLDDLLGALESRGEAMDPDLAAWVCLQAAAGLHAAHELRDKEGRPLGLVHRDISPQNILLSFAGRVYVTDFGVAKLRDARVVTDSGVVKGKFGYMSPEQTRAGALDLRSDVFSLGICLYESLVGARLFDGDSPASCILRILEHEPAPPERVRPGVPEELGAVAMRALSKRREDRYESAAAMGEALRSTLRARQAHVDEADMAALLARAVPAERQRLEALLRGATSAASASSPGPEPPRRGQAPSTSAALAIVGLKPARSGMAAVVTLLAIAAVGAGVAFWRLGRMGTPTEAPALVVSSPAAPASAAPPASAERSAAATALPAPPSSDVMPRRPSPRPAPPVPRAAPTVTTAAPPAAKPTPSNGAPFRSLD
jgi:eukaryotic-like serine/threonine-protein kinase